MVKRRVWKYHVYTCFALIMLIMCWETNRSNAAITEVSIPEESIRLRILANSDNPDDQQIKRLIRDEIIENMNHWVTSPQDIVQARAEINDHMPEINQTIKRVLNRNGYDYAYEAELAVVPFPTKMYGNQVYPAGDYEALRITLGKGEGQNWWCVLFPPLCFVDAVSGEAVAKDTSAAQVSSDSSAPAKKEVRFFLWDLLHKLFA